MSSGSFLAWFPEEGLCSECAPTPLMADRFPPLLLLQEEASEPLGQISCIWQGLGFEISTQLCSYKFREKMTGHREENLF